MLVAPDALELLEEPSDLVGRDAEPLVGHFDHDVLVAALADAHGDGTSLRRVLHGVVQEVRQDLLHPVRVGHDRGQGRGHVGHHRVAGEPEGHRLQDEGGQLHVLPFVLDLARLHPADEERVVGEPGQVVGLVHDRLHELLAALQGEVGVLQDELGEAADGHERAAEVVGDDGHELALHPVVFV